MKKQDEIGNIAFDIMQRSDSQNRDSQSKEKDNKPNFKIGKKPKNITVEKIER